MTVIEPSEMRFCCQIWLWQDPKRPEDGMKSPFLLRRLVEQSLTQWLSGKKKNLSAMQATQEMQV